MVIDLMTFYGLLFLFSVFYNDIKTMYFSKVWSLISLPFLLCFPSVSFLNRCMSSLIFFLVSFCMYKFHRDWLGSADVCFLGYFGFCLGFERFLVALYISLLIGFIWLFVLYVQKKACILPYLSCLSIGVWIAWMRGYTLFDHILNLFS